MINRLFKWLGNRIQRAREYDECKMSTQLSRATVSERIGDQRDSMNFQIHSATGGYILEFSSYDKRRDEWDKNLHIIRDDEDLGEGIAKIITIEMLRK
jgi:succinylglutamate desuccinylase